MIKYFLASSINLHIKLYVKKTAMISNVYYYNWQK